MKRTQFGAPVIELSRYYVKENLGKKFR